MLGNREGEERERETERERGSLCISLYGPFMERKLHPYHTPKHTQEKQHFTILFISSMY